MKKVVYRMYKMKKLLVIVLSLALCLTCFAMPAYADDLDYPVEPIDIDENIVYESTGHAYVYVFFSTGRVIIKFTVRGDTSLDYNGNVIDFDCLYCTVGTIVSYGSVPEDYSVNAHYVDYSVTDNTVKARVYYTYTGDGVTQGGYIYATMPVI